MPLVKISMVNIWNNEQKRKISDHIHESLVEAFRIREDDYNHQIFELGKENFLYSKYRTEKCIFIEMNIFPGRSKKAKSELYEKIVSRLSEFGIQPNDIVIVLNEPPLENWGINGKPGDQISIGINLNV